MLCYCAPLSHASGINYNIIYLNKLFFLFWNQSNIKLDDQRWFSRVTMAKSLYKTFHITSPYRFMFWFSDREVDGVTDVTDEKAAKPVTTVRGCVSSFVGVKELHIYFFTSGQFLGVIIWYFWQEVGKSAACGVKMFPNLVIPNPNPNTDPNLD